MDGWVGGWRLEVGEVGDCPTASSPPPPSALRLPLAPWPHGAVLVLERTVVAQEPRDVEGAEGGARKAHHLYVELRCHVGIAPNVRATTRARATKCAVQKRDRRVEMLWLVVRSDEVFRDEPLVDGVFMMHGLLPDDHLESFDWAVCAAEASRDAELSAVLRWALGREQRAERKEEGGREGGVRKARR